MQALHCKLYVVLVQILPYNCSETYYNFCEDSHPQQDSALYPDVGFTLRPLQPTIFFRSAALIRMILSTGRKHLLEVALTTLVQTLGGPNPNPNPSFVPMNLT